MQFFCFHFILCSSGRKVLIKTMLILLFCVAKEALENLQTTCSKSRDLIGLRIQITCFQIVCSTPSVTVFHPLVVMSGPGTFASFFLLRFGTSGLPKQNPRTSKRVPAGHQIAFICGKTWHDLYFARKFRSRSRLAKISRKKLSNFSVVENASSRQSNSAESQ